MVILQSCHLITGFSVVKPIFRRSDGVGEADPVAKRTSNTEVSRSGGYDNSSSAGMRNEFCNLLSTRVAPREPNSLNVQSWPGQFTELTKEMEFFHLSNVMTEIAF